VSAYTHPRLDTPPRYPFWYVSPAASLSIDGAYRADGRRSWDPRGDTPSLASLAGSARGYGGRYQRSAHALLRKAGCDWVDLHVVCGRVYRVRVVRLPSEPWGATNAPAPIINALTEESPS